MAQLPVFVRVPHMASHVLHIALFEGVENSAFLRQQLLDGNADFEYAFVDASSVLATSAHCGRSILTA
jgi:EKC/KEOPS complex subunit CGI121/TPRKB